MKLLIFTIALMTCCFSNAQSLEYYNVNRNFLREDENSERLLVRTDNSGKVVWSKPLTELLDPLDEGQYIIAAETSVKNGKVISNPDDYDYWIVPEEDLMEKIRVYPTVCDQFTNIIVGLDLDHRYLCKVFDMTYREINSYQLQNGKNRLETIGFVPGQYLIEFYRDGSIIDALKILIIR